jgi:hypothetical protein
VLTTECTGSEVPLTRGEDAPRVLIALRFWPSPLRSFNRQLNEEKAKTAVN